MSNREAPSFDVQREAVRNALTMDVRIRAMQPREPGEGVFVSGSELLGFAIASGIGMSNGARGILEDGEFELELVEGSATIDVDTLEEFVINAVGVADEVSRSLDF